MKKLIVLILLISSVNAFTQNKESKKILNKGKLLYRLEKASWYSTDLFVENYPDKRDSISGYLSYEKGNNVYSVYYSRYNNSKVLARYKFDSIPAKDKFEVELNVNTNELEDNLIALRLDASNIIYENKGDFFKYYQNTSMNLIPVITNNERQVYIITGPQTGSSVLLGNDYVLTYNKKNKLKKRKKLHNTLIQLPYKSESQDTSLIYTMHSHIVTKYITETDICTLLLYRDYVDWKQHIVISKKYVSLFDMENESLLILRRKVWDKIYDIGK